MNGRQVRRAAGWLARRAGSADALQARFPWLPALTMPAGAITGRLRPAEVSALKAREAHRRRVQDQPRDGRGRWIRARTS